MPTELSRSRPQAQLISIVCSSGEIAIAQTLTTSMVKHWTHHEMRRETDKEVDGGHVRPRNQGRMTAEKVSKKIVKGEEQAGSRFSRCGLEAWYLPTTE